MTRCVRLRSPLGRFLCIVLAAAMAVGPSAAVVAQTPAGNPRGATNQSLVASRQAGNIDTTYVAPEAVAVIVLRPAQVMAAPAAQFLPIEVASAAGLKYLGFDPADVDEAIAFVQMPIPGQPPEGAITLKFNKPFDATKIPPELRQHTQRGELAGRAYLQSAVPMLPSLFAPDQQTLIVAHDATLRRLLEPLDQPKVSPLIALLRSAPGGNDLYAAVDVGSLRPLIAAGLAAARAEAPPDLPREAAQFFDAPDLISAAELTFNLSGAGTSALIVHANDAAGGERLATMIDEALIFYQDMITAQLAEQATSDDPVEQALVRYAQRMTGTWTGIFRPERDGATLTFFRSDASGGQQQATNAAVVGILVALLLPAVQAAREAARRTQSMNQVKQLLLGILNYEAAHRRFPAHASYDANGRPLLSWRVHILPYIEGQALYQQFHLDEPWDSEHNRQLIPLMPEVFANPNLLLPPGRTTYLAVVGEQGIMNGTAEGVRVAEITDGTTNTIMLVEADADQAVEWTKPADWQLDPNNPDRGLGGIRPGGWIAGFVDGHVDFISGTLDPQVLKAMFTRNGGEILPPWQQ